MLARCANTAAAATREAGLGRSAVGRGSSHVDTQGCLDTTTSGRSRMGIEVE
jgi:hypothetical protein